MLARAMALLLGIGPPKDDEGGQGASGKLQGVWFVKSCIENGKPVLYKEENGDPPYRVFLSFSGDRFVTLPGAGTEPEREYLRRYDQGFRFRLRSERPPSRIDIRWSDQAES